MANNIGKITQIIGAVLDIKFTEGNLPEINDAIKVPTRDGKELVVEVSQHLGDDIVRCIAMGSTDGLVRGMDAIATGAPISVPVCNCSKLKLSRAPVSAFSIIPIVPPVYISKTEVFSGFMRTFLSCFPCKYNDIY